jgi:allantoinase
LWKALLRGEIDTIGSDHSPCSPDLKQRSDFFEIWGGIAGVQSTLPVMLDEGHHRRGMALVNIAEKLSSKPAERFEIIKKGKIEPGFDADLTLVDLNESTKLAASTLFQRHGINPYIGSTFRGQVRSTLRRGELIFQDGAIVAETCGSLVRPERI